MGAWPEARPCSSWSLLSQVCASSLPLKHPSQTQATKALGMCVAPKGAVTLSHSSLAPALLPAGSHAALGSLWAGSALLLFPQGGRHMSSRETWSLTSMGGRMWGRLAAWPPKHVLSPEFQGPGKSPGCVRGRQSTPRPTGYCTLFLRPGDSCPPAHCPSLSLAGLRWHLLHANGSGWGRPPTPSALQLSLS